MIVEAEDLLREWGDPTTSEPVPADRFDQFGGIIPDLLLEFGPVGPDTVYGFVPMLALGGPRRADHLEICRADVHLDLLSQATSRQVLPDYAQWYEAAFPDPHG